MKKIIVLGSVLLVISFRCISQVDSLSVDTINSKRIRSNKGITKEQESMIHASRRGSLNKLKSLVESGVDINFVDEKGWTPLDYAKKNNLPNAEYLLSVGAKTFKKKLPSISEGPHIFCSNEGFVCQYLIHDSVLNHSKIVKQNCSKEFTIDVNEIIQRVPYAYENVDKVFVLGDVHGQFDRVFNLLVNNKVISRKGNWRWGNGHLVFVGDIFDRGTKVTEMLWLIYKLEKQAIKQGGRVHLIFGNHEFMIFNNDLRYVADRYYELCENIEISYSSLFGKKYVLGNWLRQKPMMVKINDNVFVHGGLSPDFFKLKLPIDTVNKITWEYLNGMEKEQNKPFREIILGRNGLLWYRGFVVVDSGKTVVDGNVIDEELSFYNCKRFIVGHTEVDSISTFFNGKVIDVNIPRNNISIPEQAILIENNVIFKVDNHGKRKRLLD